MLVVRYYHYRELILHHHSNYAANKTFPELDDELAPGGPEVGREIKSALKAVGRNEVLAKLRKRVADACEIAAPTKHIRNKEGDFIKMMEKGEKSRKQQPTHSSF